MWSTEDIAVLSAVAAAVHTLGLLTSVHSVLYARTSQAAVAWAVALVSFPYLSLPLYWIFGRSKFYGYLHARRSQLGRVQEELSKLDHRWDKFPPTLTETGVRLKMLEKLSNSPWTGGNRAELLIDGEATYRAVFKTIESAREYVVVQYYILRDDEVGRELTSALLAALGRGVRVLLLWDEFGCRPRPRKMLKRLREAGAKVESFSPQKRGLRNFFRVNFRNHRKVVLADGCVACIGGLNIGREYLGRSKKYGAWRDTHLLLSGPCVEAIQLAWAEDWHWSTNGDLPGLKWEPVAAPDADHSVLILPTGPADDLESCDLMFVKALQEARRRIWISSPYFVPDPPTKAAMQLAALRGVDVRFMIPRGRDQWLVWHAAWNYFEKAQSAGVRFFQYDEGFLHQKVMLIDDDFAGVGTANFDNRSFRLNFEMTALINDAKFAGEVEAMLLADFERSTELPRFCLEEQGFVTKLKIRFANLFSQIL